MLYEVITKINDVGKTENPLIQMARMAKISDFIEEIQKEAFKEGEKVGFTKAMNKSNSINIDMPPN